MTQYLVAVLRPNDYDHSALLGEAARRDIDELNEEMKASGVTVFVGGLRPTGSAQCVRPQSNGDFLVSEGPYLVASDYVDGFWVLKCANMDEALSWARKAALACRASVEVRPFY